MNIIRRLLTLSSIVLTTLTIQAQVSFTGTNQMPPLDEPYGSVSADFNRDGKLDFAIVNYGSSSISIFTGTGTGTFGNPVNYATGDSPQHIAVGTLNGDNFPDLVVTDYYAGISVLLNLGNGLFGAKTDYTVGSSPNGVAIGDFNNDNKLDIVVANYSSKFLSILTNTGAGAFTSISNCTTTGYPYAVAVADFNGDSKNDLAVAFKYESNFGIITGTGTGSFGPEKIYGTSSSPYHVVTGDINSDGRADVVVLNNNSDKISVFTGTGSGTMGSQIDYTAGNGPKYATLADYNSDGKLDLAVVNGDKSANVFLNSGTGIFNPKVDYTLDTYVESIISGDFNSDGKQDLIIPYNYISNFALMLNSGTGTFGTPINMGAGGMPAYGVSADFNGDGKLDMASTNSDNLSIYFNNGNGIFTLPINYTIGAYANGLAVGDFNADGKIDIACALGGNSTVAVLINNGDGTFASPAEYAVGDGPNEVVVADFNVDGKPDLAVTNYTTGNVSILLNSGGGIFGGTMNYTTTTHPRGIAVGYFNSDNKPDLAIADVDAATISILLNNGSGGFPDKTDYTVGYVPYSISAGDLNGDNRADVVVSYGYNSGSVSVHINNGDGTLNTPSSYITGTYPENALIYDFNGDDKKDIAITNYTDNNVSLLVNTGNGTFKPRVNFAVSLQPNCALMGDFNGDSRQDIITLNYNSPNYISLLTNTYKYLTVIVDNASKQYNTANPAFTSKVLGLTGGDQVIVTYATTATQTSLPGQYPITPIISFIGSNFSSYTFTTVAGTLTINALTPDLTYTGATSGTVDASITLGAQSNSTGTISYSVTNGTGTAEIIANSLKLNTAGTITLTINIASVLGFNAKSIQVPITISASVPPTTTTGTSTIPGSTIPGNGTGTIIVTGNNIVNIYIWGTATGSNLANTTTTGGTQSSIGASVALANGVSADSVKGYFREISSKGSFTKIGGSQSSNTFNASLDPAAITSIGLEYYFEINQGTTKFYTDTLYVYLNFTSKVAIGTPIKTGSTVKDYQILSFPYVFTSTKVKDVLFELGNLDKTAWRLFSYNNGTSVEKTPDDNISNDGPAYWLITKKGITDFNSDGKVPLVKKSKPASIFLNKGWNLVGNPYTFNVLWTDVKNANAGKTLPDNIYTYGTSGYTAGTLLPKFSGAWVYMADTATIKIPVVKDATANSGRISYESPISNMSDGKNWEATIQVSQGLVDYNLSGIGMRDAASDKADTYDIHVLPRLPQYADISMVSSDNQLLTRNIVKSTDKYTWNASLNSDNTELPASLSWNLPAGVSLILEDGSGNKVNMSQVNKVDIKPGSNFRILYGSTETENGISISSPQPNPSTDHILLGVSLPEDGIVETKIVGLTGIIEQSEKKILSQGINSFYISTEALSAGFHLLQVNVTSGSKSYSKTFKIITNK